MKSQIFLQDYSQWILVCVNLFVTGLLYWLGKGGTIGSMSPHPWFLLLNIGPFVSYTHYYHTSFLICSYCQAQPKHQHQLGWAALFSVLPDRPAGQPSYHPNIVSSTQFWKLKIKIHVWIFSTKQNVLSWTQSQLTSFFILISILFLILILILISILILIIIFIFISILILILILILISILIFI